MITVLESEVGHDQEAVMDRRSSRVSRTRVVHVTTSHAADDVRILNGSAEVSLRVVPMTSSWPLTVRFLLIGGSP